MTSRSLRTLFWILAVALGGIQTWYTRHRIFSDGISYLSIAQAYLRGDWHKALNAYWSPLYSWLAALYLGIFHVPPYWQASSLHVINFAAFLAGCWTFEQFIRELIRKRPAGLSENTLLAAGYLMILEGGIVFIGIGYVSPDMIAFALTGLFAWLTLRIQAGHASLLGFAAFGMALGFAYLDRTAVAALSPFYFAAIAGLLWRTRRKVLVPMAVSIAAFCAIAGPFIIALSMERGRMTFGESGKLNYGWEVNGAARSVHWQGEPGDIGTPLHPTRQILKEPLPVFEFGGPVSGPYPPWYDPSYWYDGIKMRFHLANQARVAASNLSMFVIIFLLTPACGILAALVLMGRGRSGWPMHWLRDHWAVVVPPLIGVALYCLVFVDKRYVSGFVVIIWMTILASARLPHESPVNRGVRARSVDQALQWICLLFLVGIFVPRFVGPTRHVVDDLIHGREREWNVNWVLAEKFKALGLEPGDRVAYVGVGMNSDWVRLDGVTVVAEVPVSYDRHFAFTNFVTLNEDSVRKFFQSDEAAREKVYDAFRRARAVMAVASIIPNEADHTGWTRMLDPNDPHYPLSDGQIQDQASTQYHWLAPPK